MHIEKIKIVNFKCFDGEFQLSLNKGLNILVGDNEAGKSTILEAIHLSLRGWLHGRYLKNELTQSLFNSSVVKRYLASLKGEERLPPPLVRIELFFDIEDESLRAVFEGNGNSERKKKACGIQFLIQFNDRYLDEYNSLLECGEDVDSLPIEYYDFSWKSFAREEGITPRTIPLKSVLIDSSSSRYQSGSDVYISQIVREFLSDEHKVRISQAHRKMKDDFMKRDVIVEVNREINKDNISDKKVELSVDVSTKNAWETSLTTYLDDVPFHFVGRGEQCLVKTKLSFRHKKSKEANVILFEEPENHLTHSKLNHLIQHIKGVHGDKQIIVSTHSSFVANKLGLGSLILLAVEKRTGKRKTTRIDDLEEGTKEYFEKLAGYDTLRLILCKKAILVEGDSDELVVQKAYMVRNDDRLPIHDEVDVISVGTSFLRFLEIAEKTCTTVSVVTDNDGDVEALKRKYERYLGKNKKSYIEIHFDEVEDSGGLKIGKRKREFNYNTLEPKFLKANGLEKVNDILGEEFESEDEVLVYMNGNKTECALRIFDSDEEMEFPQYIKDAVE